MIRQAEVLGIALGVHHHHRYSEFIPGLKRLADELGVGEPCAIVIHGGATGLVTNGVHYLDLASELFGRGPESVVSTAFGEPINPRSPDLMFYGGTAVWSFGEGREMTICFSNRSSIFRSTAIYYRDAVMQVARTWDVEVRRRARDELEKFPAVTRTGEPTDVAFQGPVPGLRSGYERTAILLGEIESGTVEVFPPSIALQTLGACIGALEAGRSHHAIALPIDPDSEIGRAEWPIS